MNDARNAATDAHSADSAEPIDGAADQPAADPVAVLEAQTQELKDKLLRTLAEMENLRRRTERDVADARSYGIAKFARDMLDVADNMRRGLESVPADARATADGAFKALLDGVELTERDLLKKLDGNGIKPIEPLGQKFDPNLHQAMFELPDDGRPNGTVVQVVQTGYVIGDRVLRPALVGVSKTAARPTTEPGATVDRSA